MTVHILVLLGLAVEYTVGQQPPPLETAQNTHTIYRILVKIFALNLDFYSLSVLQELDSWRNLNIKSICININVIFSIHYSKRCAINAKYIFYQ